MSLNNLDAEAYVARQMKLLETLTIRKDGRWFTGTIAGDEFCALVFQNGSKYGINGGRVSNFPL